MRKIVFVTGVSTSGKTTVAGLLAGRDRGDLLFLDVDDPGTPKAGALAWLAWRCEELLAEATELTLEHDVPVIVTGIIWPHKVIESTALAALHNQDVDLRFVLLEMTKKALTERLRERLASTQKALSPYVDYNWHLQDRLRQQVDFQRGGSTLPAAKWSAEMVADAVHLIATKD